MRLRRSTTFCGKTLACFAARRHTSSVTARFVAFRNHPPGCSRKATFTALPRRPDRKRYRFRSGHCECGSMTRPLFRSSQYPGATPDERRASTTLPRTSPNEDAGKRQLLRSYSSAAPRAELLNHLAINQAPGNHPGSSAPSRIRNSLRLRIGVLEFERRLNRSRR